MGQQFVSNRSNKSANQSPVTVLSFSSQLMSITPFESGKTVAITFPAYIRVVFIAFFISYQREYKHKAKKLAGEISLEGQEAVIQTKVEQFRLSDKAKEGSRTWETTIQGNSVLQGTYKRFRSPTGIEFFENSLENITEIIQVFSYNFKS